MERYACTLRQMGKDLVKTFGKHWSGECEEGIHPDWAARSSQGTTYTRRMNMHIINTNNNFFFKRNININKEMCVTMREMIICRKVSGK